MRLATASVAAVILGVVAELFIDIGMVVRFKVVPFQFIFVIVRVCVFCCLKACQHQLCTTVASVVPPRCRAGPVVYHRCDPSMRSANAGGKHDAWASGSSLLEPRFSNLDSTLQLTETPCLWQYLTLRVVYYVLHIRAPQAGYMPHYRGLAVISH